MGDDGGSWSEEETRGAHEAKGMRKCCFWCLAILLVIVGLILSVVYGTTSKNLYAAIDSVSGLDFLHSPSPPTDVALINPAFNLTLRVNSGSPGRGACLDARTYMEVSYRCVPLAASPALPADLCVGPKRSADWHVAARGVGVRLPGFLLDGLAADARAGVEAFDVTLKRAGRDEDPVILALCGVRRVGDTVEKCYTEFTGSAGSKRC